MSRPTTDLPTAHSDPLASLRRSYAEEIWAVAGLRSQAVVEAFARVPRERFLGPGPWRLSLPELFDGRGSRATPDADPRHLYHNVSVAVDPERHLWNGQPATLAQWLDRLALEPGERVLHVGCGPGYYTAILAEVVGAEGRVTAVEVDPALAARAAASLAPWSQVEVVEGDGAAIDPGPVDAIVVSAGATHPSPRWLDRLEEGGRLVLPLTFDTGPGALGKGGVLEVCRRGERFAARFFSVVHIYPCLGCRDPALAGRLRAALTRGDAATVRSLRRDAHPAGDSCWLHGDGFCLSRQEAE